MRSFGRLAVAVALVAAVLPAAPRAQSRQAADLYQQARAREAALRTELGSASATTTPSDLLARMRTLARTYEDLWRLFPTSPYSDDALWYGAMLAGDAFSHSGDAADRTRALKMLQALTTNFPTSSLLKHVAPQVEKLEAAQPTRPAETPARVGVSPQAPTSAASQTSAALPASVASSVRTAPAAPTYATLTGIRREVLADVVQGYELAQFSPWELGLIIEVDGIPDPAVWYWDHLDVQTQPDAAVNDIVGVEVAVKDPDTVAAVWNKLLDLEPGGTRRVNLGERYVSFVAGEGKPKMTSITLRLAHDQRRAAESLLGLQVNYV